MNLSFFIARRYLFSRKQKSVINVISWISLIGIAVSTTALIVVLSVYNGIGAITQGLFNVLDAELKVEPVQGKSFSIDTMPYEQLRHLPGVGSVMEIVEENAWIAHHNREAIVSLRGVDSLYGRTTGIDSMVYGGSYGLMAEMHNILPFSEDTEIVTMPLLVPGSTIYTQLGLYPAANSVLTVRIPRRGNALGTTIDEAFITGYAMAACGFVLNKESDGRYVFADIDFVRRLLDYQPRQCSALDIRLDGSRKLKRVKEDVRTLLGDSFVVRDRMEQQPLYYKIFRSERLGIILILALIILIATLNLVASLSLLIIDKTHDIGTMRSMGMPTRIIRRAFTFEGFLIGAVGIVTGLVVGFVVCFVQQQWGVIKMGSGFIVEAFPVLMRWEDFVLTFVLVSVITALSVSLTTRRARM